MSDAEKPRLAAALCPPGGVARERLKIWMLAIFLTIAVAASYWNSFGGVMLFDDRPTIINNKTLREWRNPAAVLNPPLDTTVSGRPVANATLALNYAFGELRPWGYHLVNVLIHAGAVLALFGVVRRMLALPRLAERFGAAATPLAGMVALLWAVHPLQTESVTYIVQRVESLMGLFFLLAVYAFLRAATTESRARSWAACAVSAVWLGVATKEVAATVPPVILLMDRGLLAGTFAEAWKRRRGFYAGIFASWLLLGWLVFSAEARAGTAGLGTASSWHYLLTQCEAIAIYLKLSVWPAPLVFDYGRGLVTSPGEVLWQGLLLLGLFTGSAIAVWKNRPWGVAAAAFFVILGPSSSFVPVATQTMAEHRMYLPLAPVLLLLVLVVHRVGGRWVWSAGLAASVVFGVNTVHRNADYKHERTIWAKAAADRPGNARAVCAHGRILFEKGRVEEAIERYVAALKLDPDYFDAHNNLGIALLAQQRTTEAQAAFEVAIKLKPDDPEAANNLGMLYHAVGRTEEGLKLLEGAVKSRPEYADARSNFCILLASVGRFDEAVAHSREAIRLDPNHAEAHSNLGIVLYATDKTDEAIREYERALQLKPAFAEAQMNLGIALNSLGRVTEAVERFREAIRLKPDYFAACNNLGGALTALGDLTGAAEQYESALRINPAAADACFNLGNTYLKLRRLDEAARWAEEAVRLRPDHVESRTNLGTVLAMLGRSEAALPHLREAVRLRADSPKAWYLLGNAHAQLGRTTEARKNYEEALRLKPDYAPAKQNLANLP